jgi:hypothetical protein
MSDIQVSVTTTPETDALNQVVLSVVERLSAAQEEAIRSMLADAWDDGHRVGRDHVVSGHWNPYRNHEAAR